MERHVPQHDSPACRREGAGSAQHLRRSAQLAWSSRWWAMLSVSAQSALSATILDAAVSVLDGYDGQEPAPADVLLDGGGAPASSRLPAR